MDKILENLAAMKECLEKQIELQQVAAQAKPLCGRCRSELMDNTRLMELQDSLASKLRDSLGGESVKTMLQTQPREDVIEKCCQSLLSASDCDPDSTSDNLRCLLTAFVSMCDARVHPESVLAYQLEVAFALGHETASRAAV